MSAQSNAEEQTRLLVVDDEDPLRRALARFLGSRGFAVSTAASGFEALKLLGEQKYELMLLDIRMPGMSGIDLVPEALDRDPDLAIVMLSAMTDATSAALCMQRGALDYLTKPIELRDLGIAIDRALKVRDTNLQNKEISAWLKEEVQHRTKELEEERRKLEQVTIATLEALVNALEAKNQWLSGHSARVAAFVATIAHQMGLPDPEVDNVRMAGRLHDLGKIGIRESVLNKKGRLTDEEYQHIKEHVIIGSQILAPLKHLGAIVSYVRSHHEHWDGSGYPDQLVGEDIPIGARIICAAEVYDALTTARPYQQPLAPDAAVERMQVLTETIVDPNVMKALKASVRSRTTLIFIDEDESPPG
ncbi:MAG: HD domain-containing phosphohydrolase [Gemmatimonadales bacterium]